MISVNDIIMSSILMFSNPLAIVSPDEAQCMALNIYHESRSENLRGQIAVANVTKTRAKDKRFPVTICGVVKEKKKKTCSFSWFCDGKSDRVKFYKKGKLDTKERDAFIRASIISAMVLSYDIPDSCYGANFYYNHKLVKPRWAKLYTKTCVVGNHTFLRREKGSQV